jgi:hypothetical protein
MALLLSGTFSLIRSIHLHNLKIVASITFTGIIFGKLETNIFSLAGEKVNQSCTVATKQVRSLVM